MSTKDRWKFTKDNFKTTATPHYENMMAFVKDASMELARKMAASEESLILENTSTEAVQRLMEACKKELRKRDKNT